MAGNARQGELVWSISFIGSSWSIWLAGPAHPSGEPKKPDRSRGSPRKGLWLLDDEEGAFGVCRKIDEIDMTVAQELFNHRGRGIAATHPDDLGRMTKQETALVEVGVFGHNGESLLHSMAPHGFIGGFTQADLTHMLGIGVLSLQDLTSL